MRRGQLFDQAVQAQASQLVAHAARADVVGTKSLRYGEHLAQRPIGEASCEEDEHQQRVQQRLHAWVGKAQGRDTLAVDGAWAL